MNKIATIFALMIVASSVAAECNGRLEVLDIGERDVGERINAVVSTDQYTNSTILRNVNVYLLDPGDDVAARVDTRFSTTDSHTNLEIRFEDTENLLNGSYQIKVEMNVIDSNNNNNQICGKIVYSNHFKVKSSRVYYDNSPLYISLSQQYATQPFSYNQRQCDSGMCFNLNVAGQAPLNWTFTPVLNWSLMNSSTSTDRNLVMNADMWYNYGQMKSCYESLANATNSLSAISSDLIVCRANTSGAVSSMSNNLDQCRVQTNALTAEKAACTADIAKINSDFAVYKATYNYTPTEAGMLGFGIGVFALYALMFTYNKSQSQKDPVEKADV